MTEEFTYATPRRCGIIEQDVQCCLVTTTTLLITALAVSAAAAAAGTYSSISQGKQAEAAGKYNAKVERNNALTATREAQFQADRIRKRNRLIAGKQRAAYVKSGIDLSGSAEDVMLDSATEGELDVLSRQYAGSSAATSFTARSRLFGSEAAAAGRAGYVGAAGALLGGAAKAGNIYSNYAYHNQPEF